MTQARPHAQLTQRRILSVALRGFAERGFAGASTRSLAAEAGVNIATLAYHFGDKQGLYDATVDHAYETLLADAELPVLAGPPEERVRILAKAAWSLAQDHRVGLRFLMRHVLDEGRLPAATQDRWLAVLLPRVQGMLAALNLPKPPPPVALLSLNHLLARYAITEPGDLAAFVDPDGAQEALGDHIADVAVALLCGSAAPWASGPLATRTGG